MYSVTDRRCSLHRLCMPWVVGGLHLIVVMRLGFITTSSNDRQIILSFLRAFQTYWNYLNFKKLKNKEFMLKVSFMALKLFKLIFKTFLNYILKNNFNLILHGIELFFKQFLNFIFNASFSNKILWPYFRK